MPLLLLPGGAAAQEASGTPPQTPTEPVEVVKTNGDIKVKLNFQDAPLQTVLEYLSETAGLTIVSDEAHLRQPHDGDQPPADLAGRGGRPDQLDPEGKGI